MMMSDPLLDEAFRVFPAWQDFVDRLTAGEHDPLTIDPRTVAVAFEKLENDAVIRVVYMMLANGYAETIFEAGALVSRLYRNAEAGQRPRYAVELGIA